MTPVGVSRSTNSCTTTIFQLTPISSLQRRASAAHLSQPQRVSLPLILIDAPQHETSGGPCARLHLYRRPGSPCRPRTPRSRRRLSGALHRRASRRHALRRSPPPPRARLRRPTHRRSFHRLRHRSHARTDRTGLTFSPLPSYPCAGPAPNRITTHVTLSVPPRAFTIAISRSQISAGVIA